ncbi:MAG TPA: HipA domain-containing protein [Candidatus Acidoferrum sp.]|jgi:serine/threonine-protein kinase HipA|nr:HipA domain-containing protein [Candidatus Acidoferrum sp.]
MPTLRIKLGNRLVGTITNVVTDKNIFVFDPGYIEDEHRPVLSLSYYDIERKLITRPREVQRRLPPFFSNLLPERDGVLRDYLAQRAGISPEREFPLLWLVGADLPGAVIAEDSEGVPLPPPEEKSGTREANEQEVLRFSLAGVQLKFSAMGRGGKQLRIPAQGRDGQWIVKLPSPRFPKVPENEFAMMTLAREVGIDVPEFGLMPVGSIANLPPEFADDKSNAYFIRRFDRGPDGERIHAEDFNQIYGQYPEQKYEQHGYTGMAKDIWALLGERGLTEFIRRVIFNAAIGNADMHLKNWSLLYRDGRMPTLAPGYDYVSTMRYLPERGLGLPLARTKDVSGLDNELLEKASVQAGVPRGLVKDVAHETARSFMQAWSQHKAGLPIDDVGRRKIDEQLKLVPLLKGHLPIGKPKHKKS